MALPPSGPITMGMINTELSYPATQIISLNDAAVRALAQVPSGVISLSNFYGKSATINKGWIFYPQTTTSAFPPPATVARGGAFVFDFSTETFAAVPTAPKPTGFGETNYNNTQFGHSNTSKSNFYGSFSTPTGGKAGMTFEFSTQTNASLPAGTTLNLVYDRALASNGVNGYNSWTNPATTATQNQKAILSSNTMSVVGTVPYTPPANSNVNYGAAAYSSAPLGRGHHVGGQSPTPGTGGFANFVMTYTFATDTFTKTPTPAFTWVTTQVPAGPNGLNMGANFCNGTVGYGIRNTGVDKFVLSTQVRSPGYQTIPGLGIYNSSVLNNTTTAWMLGGRNAPNSGSPAQVSTVRKYSLSTETYSTAPYTTPVAQQAGWQAQGIPNYG